MKRMLAMAVVLACLGENLQAQGRVPPTDEFLRLQPVLHTAMNKVAASIVTIETYGGTRKILVGGGPNDGPRRRPKPADPRPEPPVPIPRKKPKLKPVLQPGFLQSQGATSGVILTSDGWILVSRFALNFDPSTILVTLPDGRAFNAVRGGEDTSRGLALIKIEADDLPTAEFVHPDRVQVGQWAFALGRTFARTMDPTVHMGIVSATRRQFGRALQIDAYTSPANYGGPVIDIKGRVLGISVPLSPAGRDAGAEWYDSGIGFAATVGDISQLIERMKKGEVLNRGWLGIKTYTKDMGPGAKIAGVPRDGAAHGAGLRKNDVILEVDGIEVMNPFHLQMLVSSRMGGEPVHLKVKKRRSEEIVGMTVFLADTPYKDRQAGPSADEFPSAFPWEGKDK